MKNILIFGGSSDIGRSLAKYLINMGNNVIVTYNKHKVNDIKSIKCDIRNEEDLEYKKASLNSIYGYLEPRRTEFKKYVCSSISEEFFAGMNNFGIRHNTKAQVKMQTKKKL